jgi:hypothetical protein
MQTAGMDGRRRVTPARRRAFVALAAALVLSSPFMARAEASDGPSGAAADQPTDTSLAAADGPASTTTPGDSPCVTTPPASTSSSTTAPSSGADAGAGEAPATSQATSDQTTASTATGPCNGESDTGSTPRSAHDDCEDTGGSPTGVPRSCPARPQGSPDGPDDRLADCAGDIFQQSCADLARALEVQCASTWSAWCLSTAPNMLWICADGDQWSAPPCERARPVLVRYCSEVPDADPQRCPTIRPADGGPKTDEGAPPASGDHQSAAPPTGGAAGPRPGTGSTGDGGTTSDSHPGGPASTLDRPVDAPLVAGPGQTPPAKVVKKGVSPTVGAATIEAKADPLAVGGTIAPELGVAAAVDAGETADTTPASDEPMVETFNVHRSEAGLGSAAAVRQASSGLEPRSTVAAQRAHDRWSLVSLGGALLLVLITSAYDLRGRRRW